MISLISCSRNSDVTLKLKDNINATIGCEYELIVIDNSKKSYNIFQAYNEGVSRSKGDILCFMHDDVLFRSDDWGRIIEDHFLQYDDVGILSFFGGHYLPKALVYWPDTRIESVNYIQGKIEDGKYKSQHVFHSQYRKQRTFVAACDGVFMAMPKRLFADGLLKWDDVTFDAFHFYDMDMAMQVHQLGLKIEIIWDVLLEHQSGGNYNADFMRARVKWYEKWKDKLPIIEGVNLSDEQIEIANTTVDMASQMYENSVWLQSVLNSKEYRLGCNLMKPIRIIKKILKSK